MSIELDCIWLVVLRSTFLKRTRAIFTPAHCSDATVRHGVFLANCQSDHDIHIPA